MKSVCLTLALLWTALAGIGRAAEIQLRPTAQAAGSLVVLGDVAEIFARDAQQADELRQMELFPAPAIGNKRFVRMREVQDVLELRGFNLAEHTFSGANQTTLTAAVEVQQHSAVLRVSRTHSASEVRRAHQIASAAVIQHLTTTASAEEEWSVELDLNDDAIRAVLAASRLERVSGGQAPWTGVQEFVLQVKGTDGVVALAVRSEVRVAPAIVVATHAVPRGAVIQASDVMLDRSQAPAGKVDVVTSLDDVIGKEAAQAIVAGRPIDKNAVRQPVLVRKGEVVTVYVRAPGVQIRTAARSKDTGSHGELISVESLENRQTYLARVTGIQEAEVFARGQSASETPR